MNQRYIITGAPGTGKTSIINELKKRGFHCINENSREIINEQLISGGDILPWKNQVAFENKIANLRTQQYLSSPDDCVCFFDRSVIDGVAYLKTNKLEVTSEIYSNIKKCNYNKLVFYTPIWKKIYRKDNERKEEIEQAIKINNYIISVYQLKGYKMIEIPKISIKERANFIISKI